MPVESGSLDTIAGLPVHPLVVHAALVLLPAGAIALLVLLVVPRWRERYGSLTLLVLAAGAGASLAARWSGEALTEAVGLPQDHARWGTMVPVVAVALLLVALAWWVVSRNTDRSARSERSKLSERSERSELSERPTGSRRLPAAVLGALTAVLAVGATGLTVLAGHSGAEAVWAHRTRGAAPPPVTPPPTAPPPTPTEPTTSTVPTISATPTG
ncbi:MAG: hypothetical protein CSA84_04985 [Actinomycetales bacterium]|nr:MAG: hypothetical protein CSA84_04985 [Actinomycetales bacterium]